MRVVFLALALALPLFSRAAAEDKVRLAAGARGVWETAAPQLGLDAGLFKRHGIALDVFYTQGSGETEQAVIAGSVEIGVGLGTPAVMAAFVKGAPIRIIGNCTTGPTEYWYVRGDSPIHSMKEAAGKRIAYSTTGASSYIEALAFFKLYGIKAELVATGGLQATLTQLMSEQVDVGWSTPPFGLADDSAGKIRIIAHASELLSFRDQTVRVIATNAAYLAANPDILRRFLLAYRETLQWMYADPAGLAAYAAFSGLPQAQASRVREFYPPQSVAVDRISGLDEVMADAVTSKYLAAPLTKAQLDQLFQLPVLEK